MPQVWQLQQVLDVSDQVVAAATETVVATTPGVVTDGPGRTIWLSGFVVGTGVAGTTGCTVRIRRTGLGGTLVGEAIVDTRSFVGAVTASLPLGGNDAPGEVSGQAYVVTIEPAGGQITKLQAQLCALVDRG